MAATQDLTIQLSNRVTSFLLSDVSASNYFEEANELVLRGFSRHTAKGKVIDSSLKSLRKPSDSYGVIVSLRENVASGKREIFSVMTIARGTKAETTIEKDLPPLGHIVFSLNRHSETVYLHNILGVKPYELSEVGNFVCIDKENRSLVRTSEGFEAFFNALRIGSIWSQQAGMKFSTAVMKPKFHQMAQRLIGMRYLCSGLQPNLEAFLPNDVRVSEFVDNIPGYISLGTSEQPTLYYMPTPQYYRYMNKASVLLRAKFVSLILQSRRFFGR